MDEDEEESGSSVIELEELLNKNTESFQCLAQITVSHSSIFRHPLYPFPPLENPGLDETLFYIDDGEIDEDIGTQKYIQRCKLFNIVPLKRVLNSLATDTLDLKYYGIKRKQIQAITETLMNNKFVKSLIFQDNWLNDISVRYISAMLAENKSVNFLDLRECRILTTGAAILNRGIAKSKSLTELDLSFNSLDDKGVANLEESLSDSHTIRILNLSHNNLGEDAATTLGSIMTFNSSIIDLNLSWNNFNTQKGNKLLFTALGENELIQKLNIAWNTISSNEATRPIMNFLAASSSLTDFDISNNRLTATSYRNVRSGLGRCTKLKTLKIGNNLLTAEEAVDVLRLFKALPKLIEIDVENTFITPEGIPLIKVALKRKRVVTIGGVLDNYSIKGPDCIKLLFGRANFLAKKKKKDFGIFIGQLPSENMVIDEFVELVKKAKIGLDQDLVTAVVQKFPAPKQKLSCSDLQDSYIVYYPDTVILCRQVEIVPEELLPEDADLEQTKLIQSKNSSGDIVDEPIDSV